MNAGLLCTEKARDKGKWQSTRASPHPWTRVESQRQWQLLAVWTRWSYQRAPKGKMLTPLRTASAGSSHPPPPQARHALLHAASPDSAVKPVTTRFPWGGQREEVADHLPLRQNTTFPWPNGWEFGGRLGGFWLCPQGTLLPGEVLPSLAEAWAVMFTCALRPMF